jgi:hypothetical protein
MLTQGFGCFAASTLGYAASRLQRLVFQILTLIPFRIEIIFALFLGLGIQAQPTWFIVGLFGLSKFYEINTRLAIRQLIWTALG